MTLRTAFVNELDNISRVLILSGVSSTPQREFSKLPLHDINGSQWRVPSVTSSSATLLRIEDGASVPEDITEVFVDEVPLVVRERGV